VESTWKALVAEFVGTFALIFIGAGAVVLNAVGTLDLVGVALAHGLVLAIMVSVSIHTSGGMFNPAVAAALWVTGKLSSARTVAYIVAQLVAAVAGAFLLEYLVDDPQLFAAAKAGAPQVAAGVEIGRAIIIEAVTTFFLVWAVFGTVVDDRGPFGKTAGLTIGLVIAFDILAFGPYTGASMNPARWFGPALAGGLWDDWYVYLVGPFAGGVLAGLGYWATFLRDREPATP
jgi:MIP family channel proteins